MIQLKPGVAFAACVLGLLLTGCDSTPPIVQTGPPVVTVSQPLEKEIVDYDQYTGRIEAAETVEAETIERPLFSPNPRSSVSASKPGPSGATRRTLVE